MERSGSLRQRSGVVDEVDQVEVLVASRASVFPESVGDLILDVPVHVSSAQVTIVRGFFVFLESDIALINTLKLVILEVHLDVSTTKGRVVHGEFDLGNLDVFRLEAGIHGDCLGSSHIELEAIRVASVRWANRLAWLLLELAHVWLPLTLIEASRLHDLVVHLASIGRVQGSVEVTLRL